MTADAWGIEPGYWDAAGTWWDVPPETIERLRAASGADPLTEPPAPERPVWFVRAGDAAPLAGPGSIRLEDGSETGPVTALPPDLPLGYHDLAPVDGGPPTSLVVTPGRCHLPDGLRAWGWATQLYAARSRRSWGIGDLTDLRALAEWSAGLGAGLLVLNPLHADSPARPQQPSPYYPSSRRFRNVLYLDVEAVPGAELLGESLAEAAAAARALDAERHIDRDRVLELKLGVLERIWEETRHAVRRDADFLRFCHEQGPALEEFVRFACLAEEHGPGYPTWPVELRHPASPAVEELATQHADRLAFHRWCQWLLERQLASAAGPVALVKDLAVGFDPGGADAWAWQDLLAPGVRVGAPPDEFNQLGQDWGLPPFVPWRLRAAGYRPVIETLRAVFRHAGGIRIDHIMGLSRLFWIPPGAGPVEGTYVRYPFRELLDLVALESERAGAFVVGEDLGTVEDEVREEMRQRRILSYRLVWFEPGHPSTYPELALAAVTTHDLPTVAGLLSSADVAAQTDIGLEPNLEGAQSMRRALEEAAGVRTDGEGADGERIDTVVLGVHRSLGESPPALVTATLDDALQVEERPNMPGTVDAWPNWQLALPKQLDEVMVDPFVLELAAALDAGRRATS